MSAKSNKSQGPSKQTKTAQPSKKATTPIAVAMTPPAVKATAQPVMVPVSAAVALAAELAKNEPAAPAVTTAVAPTVIKSAQAQCRVMFTKVGDRHTLEEIQSGRFTTSAVLTALSDLKNPKYAKGGDCLIIRRDPNAEGKTYVRVQ